MTDTLDTGAEVAQEHVDGDAASEPTVESLARDLGWKPQDEFTLEPDRWVGAAQYIKSRGDKLSEARTVAKNARDEAKRIGATTERMMERARAEERDRLEADLQRQQDEGDTQAAVETARKLERASTPSTPPETAAWLGRNQWMDTNPAARALAIGVCEQEAGKGLPQADQLAAAEAEVRRVYPQLFGDRPSQREERKPAPATQPGTRTASVDRTGPKTQTDLPPAAKDALRAAVSRVPEARRDSFSKSWISAYYEDKT